MYIIISRIEPRSIIADVSIAQTIRIFCSWLKRDGTLSPSCLLLQLKPFCMVWGRHIRLHYHTPHIPLSMQHVFLLIQPVTWRLTVVGEITLEAKVHQLYLVTYDV